MENMDRFIILLAMLICLTASCEKQNTAGKNVVVKISDPEYNGSILKFKILTKGVTSLEYSISPYEGTEGEFIEADPLPSQEISVSGLKYDTEYIITAKASGGKFHTSDECVITTIYSPINYSKKILVTKFTGTWCGYCPLMNEALIYIEDNFNYDFTVCSFHLNDEFTIPESKSLASQFQITDLPSAVIDYRYTSTQTIMSLTNIFNRALISNKAVCGIGLDTKISGNTLTINANMKFGVEGRYKICVLLLEDKLKSDNVTGSLGGSGIYDDVARKFLTDFLGKQIGEVAAGEEKTYSFTTHIPPNWDKNNLKVVAYLMRANKSGTFYVNNANICKAGKSAKIEIDS